MSEIQIHTHIYNRYHVFDASNQLSFNIIFDFCRRSFIDINFRSLIVEIVDSILNVSYALTHDLLILHEQMFENVKKSIEINFKKFSKIETNHEHFIFFSFSVDKKMLQYTIYELMLLYEDVLNRIM